MVSSSPYQTTSVSFMKHCYLVYFCLMTVASFGQKTHTVQVEMGAIAGSSNQVPFWHQTNQFGAAPSALPALTGRVRVFSDPIPPKSSTGKRRLLDWNYGLDVVGNAASRSNVALIEGYLGVRLGAFRIEAGRKRETIGLIDTLLTTGAVSYSGNALPIPKVQLSTNGFVEIPFTKQLFAFQSTFAHGWFGPQRVSPNYFRTPPDGVLDYYGHYVETYFHQKTFYGRFGKPTWKVNLYGGFNDLAFWGNEAVIWNPGFQLSTAESFRRVVMGVNWSGSKVGNHFGTIDLAASIKGKAWDVFVYRQSIFDTGSLLNALNIDALNGIRLRNKKTPGNTNWYFKNVLLEFLYTNDQRDPLVGGGRNDYFNHYIYLDGWSYRGRGLGTPLAVIDRDLKGFVGNSINQGGYIANNRIVSLHVGLDGTYKRETRFMAKFSLSHNKGTNGAEFSTPRNQLSTFVSVSKPLRVLGGSEGRLSLSADVGELYPARAAIQVSIIKTWHL